MRRACVIGWPVEHSRSPLIHGYWLEQYGIDGAYEKQAVRPEALARFLGSLGAQGYAGANVTLPHKEAALKLAAVADEAARAIGAANTLWLDQAGRLCASNTDAYGFITNLNEEAPGWNDGRRPVMVLGAGGAARAILHSLLAEGATRIFLANRTRERAEALARAFGPAVKVIDWEDRNAALSGCGLLVNATSLGMTGKEALDIDLAALPKDAVVADIVYSPLETRFARGCARQGQSGGRWTRHAAASGGSGFRNLVWRAPRSHSCAEGPRRCLAWGGMMLVIGLTGGIGMGKSAAAEHFARRGVPVFNADACVHRLYDGEAVGPIEAAFPGATRGGKVDRKLLSEKLAGSQARLKELEAIVHPMVVAAEIDFLIEQEDAGAKLAVLEIPLLFETGAEQRVDVTIALTAPAHVQRERVLARPGMTVDKLEHLLARQLSDAERRARADYVVDSGMSLEDMHEALDKLIELLHKREGRVMQRLRLRQR